MLRARASRCAVLLALGLALALPSQAAAFQLAMPQASDTKPAGFRLSGTQAIRIAARTKQVRAEGRTKGPLYALTAVPLGTTTWQVGFYSGKKEVARAIVDGVSGQLIGPVYTGNEVLWPSARGVPTKFRNQVDLATLALCLLFILPFIDPRRPFRMLHLDLLALIGFEVSFILLQTEHLEPSVAIQYIPMLYLLGRLMWIGLRGRRDEGPAVPFASDRVLAAGLVALVVGRLAFNLFVGQVGDVGYAGLFGADGIRHGYNLYGNSTPHLDAYGPINYFIYLPFETLWPLGPGWSHNNVQGAHATTITLDLIMIVLLMVLGRRLQPGRAGRRLGLTLAYAWAAYPFAFFPLAISSNDEIVALTVVLALLFYASAPARGLVLGLGAAAKFSPLAILPVFALGRKRSWRDAFVVAAVAAAVFVLTFVPYVRQTSLHTVWKSTIWFQMNRDSPFTLWGLHPSLGWVHPIAEVLAIAVIAVGSLLPRERTLVAVAALSGAALIAVQMAGTYWAHTYVAWFAPSAFVALFAGRAVLDRGARPLGRLVGREREVARS